MEREQDRYVRIKKIVDRVSHHYNPRHTHADSTIAGVLLWAALHDRPVAWSCDPGNWPRRLRPACLPTQSCMSRRLPGVGVQQLLERVRRCLRDRLPAGLLKFIDAKPLPVGGCSKDADALYGRAAACKAKGYKLYAIIDAVSGALDQWLLGPMNWSEQKAAMVMFGRMAAPAVIVGDGEYDTTPLYDLAAARGCALLAPAPRTARGTGHRYVSPYRRDGLALSGCSAGLELFTARIGIEQHFAHLTSGAGGLGPLPAWVRRPHRVAAWVAAKLILDIDRHVQHTKQKASAA